MRFPLASLLLFCALMLPSGASTAAPVLAPDGDEVSGYTEIEECGDCDACDDDVPLNAIEDRYNAGRMAFLFGQYEVAYKAWLPLAEEGYAKAQASLGWMYHTGNGAKKNLSTAAGWYRLAADQGHAIAQNNLGVMHENGLIGPVDEKLAASWYLKAANQGYAYAQYNLGILYAEGRGVAQDPEQARYWLQIASRQKVKQATEALGKLNLAPPVEQVAKPKPRVAHAPYHSNPVAKGILWVNKQNPAHYTIQLARSKDMEWILRLAASANLKQPMVHFKAKNKEGEEWHHLIYGSFATKEEALQASKALPEAMRKWSPWLRPFSEIQQQIAP